MGKPLTKCQYDLLYQRAMTGSVKEAAAALGKNFSSSHHVIATAFRNLGVEDMTAAFRALGWLRPIPYDEDYDAYYDEHL